MIIQLDDLLTHPLTQVERARYVTKVQKTDTCWFWTGARMINGYGLLTIRHKQILAHRMAYFLEYGTLPEDQDICHTCDVRSCVNPAHLVPGTRQENLGEMHQKRRGHYDRHNPSLTFQKIERTCLNCGTVFVRTISTYREELPALCSTSCRKEWGRRNIKEDFWKHVDRSHPDGCWLWRGRIHRNGYGQVGYRGRDRLAHRFAWRLVHGDIPPHMHVLHACDTPSCVNPAHLSLGTRSENMQDAVRKGRLNGPGILPGELHPNSKLSNAQRQDIRERHAHGESYGQLARAFNVGKTTIARIIRSPLTTPFPDHSE